MDLKAFIEAINVSQGKTPADICFTNGIVADVFSGEFLTDVDVLVDNGVIVDCVKTGSCEAKETIDLKGAYLLSGFIDTHVHIESSMLSPERFCDLVVPHGTIVVIADPHEKDISNICRIEVNFLNELARIEKEDAGNLTGILCFCPK